MRGRLTTILDLGTGMAGSKLLTDKAHRDGSPVRRNRSDLIKKAADPVRVDLDDKQNALQIAYEPRKGSPSKKAGGTPMKMYIAEELLKETECKRQPPSVVARLMGLDDALPAQQPVLTVKRSSQDCHQRSKSAGAIRGRRQPEDCYFDTPRSCEIHSCSYEKECKDVHEIWQQPSRTNRFTDQPLQKGIFNGNQNEMRMDLVRQKFMEAKRLATDEKLLQSKEFQDALDVLSSNRDLFLKFLEEPNSLFSKHVEELHVIPSPHQAKHITVLKPAKTVESKVEKHLKKQQYPEVSGSERDIQKPNRASDFSRTNAEDSSHPTRIVVLKPSPAKTHDTKVITAELLQHNNFYRASEVGEALGSKEIAKEITRQMRVSVSGHRRDESLLSSVLSNGYVGDESSFEKSENEFIEGVGNFIDSEVMAPSSRHSWDYDNRIGTSSSHSSFSRTSCSPESSVLREAKKRLSERWAMVASNGISPQQTKVWGGSGTLREMLAIPEVKKEDGSDGVLTVSSCRSCVGEEDLKAPSACLSIGRTKDGDCGENSPRQLSRSKSVPASSSVFGNIGLHVETSNPHINKPSVVAKEVTKPKSGKSFLKGKVSSFFSRNKKSGKQKATSSPSEGTDQGLQLHSDIVESVCKNSDDLSKPLHENLREEIPLVNSKEESSTASSPTSVNDGPEQHTLSKKAAVSLEKPKTLESLSGNQDKLRTSGNPSENQDQPSPTSVLDPLFEDDVNNDVSPSSEIADTGPPQTLSRSAPIESIARSLSWDDTHLEIPSPNLLKLLGADEEEQERFMLVQNLLSSAGLDHEKVNTAFMKWHSAESPLDPLLLVKVLDREEEEGKSRERRSSRRLVFDCVNAALLDIGRAAILGVYTWTGACGEARKDAPTGALVAEEVWRLLRDCFSGERNQASPETDGSSLVVDGLLRRELVGRGWAELMRAEVDEISKEIGGRLLDDLVAEAFSDFTSECLS